MKTILLWINSIHCIKEDIWVVAMFPPTIQMGWSRRIWNWVISKLGGIITVIPCHSIMINVRWDRVDHRVIVVGDQISSISKLTLWLMQVAYRPISPRVGSMFSVSMRVRRFTVMPILNAVSSRLRPWDSRASLSPRISSFSSRAWAAVTSRSLRNSGESQLKSLRFFSLTSLFMMFPPKG